MGVSRLIGYPKPRVISGVFYVLTPQSLSIAAMLHLNGKKDGKIFVLLYLKLKYVITGFPFPKKANSVCVLVLFVAW